MSTSAIISPLGAQKSYLSGFGPDSVAGDPVLKALAGKRVSENTIRRSVGLSSAPSRRRKAAQPVAAPVSSVPRLLAAHFKRKGGTFYPDAVTDTKAKRQRDKVPVLARLEKLAALYPDGLKLYRLTLGELDGLCLYDPQVVEDAKKAARRWLRARGLRGEVKVERGRCGSTHVHIVTSAAGAGGVDVYDLDGLAAYLVKPADARACMPKRGEAALYSAGELQRQKIEAAENFLRAETWLKAGKFGERRKLPRMFGSCS